MKYKRLKENLNVMCMHNHTQGARGRVVVLTNGRKTENQVIDEVVSDCREILNKIEQGTLIELPCKVGDTVYFIDEKRWVWEMVVVEIAILKKNIVCEIGNRRKEVRSVWKENWGKTIFFTREEAEKRLKELQNG